MSQQLTPVQTQYFLTLLSNFGGSIQGSSDDIAQKLLLRIESELEDAEPYIGQWEVVWGPGVYQHDDNEFADNVMYAAYNNEQNQYSICIAGTGPNSRFNWIELNLAVCNTEPWPYGDAGPDVEIARGTWTGLEVLQDMSAANGVPAQGERLVDFLTHSVAEKSPGVQVITNGFSLGGALSPTLALWLQDTQEEWDHERKATISTWPFAGPTTGNQAFQEYSDERLETNRVANSLDVVPHAWNEESLEEVNTLYTPDIGRSLLVNQLVRCAKMRTCENDYHHIDPDAEPLEGEVDQTIINPDNNFKSFLEQMLYQHSTAYSELLEMPDDFKATVEEVQENFKQLLETHLPELEKLPQRC